MFSLWVSELILCRSDTKQVTLCTLVIALLDSKANLQYGGFVI